MRHHRARRVCYVQAEVVTGSLKDRQRLRDQRVHLVGYTFRRDVKAQVVLLDPGEELRGRIASGGGRLRCSRQGAAGFFQLASLVERFGELDLERDLDLVALGESSGALQQVDGGTIVLAYERAPTGVSEAVSPAWRQRLAGDKAKFFPVPPRLFKVVPEDLVQLDERGVTRLQPVREALV